MFKRGNTTAMQPSKRKFDVVLVAPELSVTAKEREEGPDKVAEREAELAKLRDRRFRCLQSIKAVGMDVIHFTQQDDDDPDSPRVQYFLVGASEDLLKQAAGALGLEKKIKFAKPENWRTEVYEEYSVGADHRFQPDDFGNGNFFTSLERIRTLFYLIESASYNDPPCAEQDLDKLVADKVFSGYFTLQDKARLESLRSTWIYASPWTSPPINEIRDYLGEKIALYFAWMNVYTNYLGSLGILGVLPMIYGYMSDSARFYDNALMPIYGVAAIIWAQLFIEHWKRKQETLQFQWNTEDFEDEEVLRPEFRRSVQQIATRWRTKHPDTSPEDMGVCERYTDPVVADYRRGRWTRAGFIDVPEDDEELKKEVPETEYFSESAQKLRYGVSMTLTAALVLFILCVSTCILGMRAWLQQLDMHSSSIQKVSGAVDSVMSSEDVVSNVHVFAPAIAAGVNAVFISIMTFIWSYVGVWLTDYEMHRTDTSWEDSYIWKTFGFQFINSYITTIYIAFVQPLGIKLPYIKSSSGEDLYDTCVTNSSTGLPDCFLATFNQAAMLIVLGQLQRVAKILIPWAMQKYRACRASGEDERKEIHRQVVSQATASTFAGTYYEYLEMAIQFGWVCMFAVAFPLGGIICFLVNIAEKRTDAIKVALLMRRPKYLGAQDIGSVQDVLNFIANMAIVTNFIILMLSSKAYKDYFAFLGDIFPAIEHEFSLKDTVGPMFLPADGRFWAFVCTVILEHTVIAAKEWVAWAIPDTPQWVEEERARIVMRKEAFKQAQTLSKEAEKRRKKYLDNLEKEKKKTTDMTADDDVDV